MFDSYLVVKDTLKNDVVDGKVVGFRLGVRIANYRGEFLSLVNGFYIEVDGVVYPREVQKFEINGKPPRDMDEIATCHFEHWDMQDMGIVHIAKEGGLAPGKHKIKYMECILGGYGYYPPQDDLFINHTPTPGDPRAAQKTNYFTTFELELKED